MILVLLLISSAVLGEVTEADDLEELPLSIGDHVRFSLKSKKSTGYSWKIVPPKGSILTYDSLDGEYIPPSSRMMGASGTQVFGIECTFKCKDGSEELVRIEYGRPWESEPATVKELRVQISSNNI